MMWPGAPGDGSWYGYINSVVTASAGYLPAQVTDTLTQGRAFATVHLARTATRNICALAVIRKCLRLVVCDGTGCLGLYSLDLEEGGDCSLIKQFSLADTDPEIDSLSGSLQQLQTDHQPTSQDPSVTYSDKLRNRDGREMTESEKFHEMASATEAPPKTCFLLDDDGEFPPVAFAAS